MSALHWLGAWFGVAVPVSLAVGAVLHAAGAVAGEERGLRPATVESPGRQAA